MAHIVTERCVDCRYTDCCTVCPVDCFYEVEDPAMLVIDPAVCIDCALCVAECPIQAIWPEDELPDEYADWVEKNADLVASGTNIKTRKDAMAGALTLEQIQAREKERGWSITEPSAADGEGEGGAAEGGETQAAPAQTAATAAVSEDDVLKATLGGKFKWRSARGLARELNGVEADIHLHLDQLTNQGKLQTFANTNASAPAVFGKP